MVLSFLNDLSSIVVHVSNKRHVKNPEAVVWLYSKMKPSFDVSIIASSLDESQNIIIGKVVKELVYVFPSDAIYGHFGEKTTGAILWQREFIFCSINYSHTHPTQVPSVSAILFFSFFYKEDMTEISLLNWLLFHIYFLTVKILP